MNLRSHMLIIGIIFETQKMLHMTIMSRSGNKMISKCFYFVLLFQIIVNVQAYSQNKPGDFKKVNALLEHIMDIDQQVRKELGAVSEQYGHTSQNFKDAWTKMLRTDSLNQIKIDSIFTKYGWLVPPAVSEKASKAYFYVIQHARYEYQQKYRSNVINAFQQHTIGQEEYQIFIDRIAVREKKYQVYGSQVMNDPAGNAYFVPIDTTENKDVKIREDFKGQGYILLSNKELVAVFVHIYNKDTDLGIAGAEIYIDNKKIGESNNGGFFQILIPRFADNKTIKVTSGSFEKKSVLSGGDQKDYFDIYFLQ